MEITVTDKIKTLISLMCEPKVLAALLSLRHSGYLMDIGWFNAFKSKKPVDNENNPIPWLTYSFISFISPRLNKKLNVFEYGSGSSTLYFSKLVERVISVEHAKFWYEKIKNNSPENVKLFYYPVSEENSYVNCIHEQGVKFNIVLIDAVRRVECLTNCIKSLEDNGVIILDDSERVEYKPGTDFLLKNGFKRLDFWGISPGYLYHKSTSVFYKEKNCLDI